MLIIHTVQSILDYHSCYGYTIHLRGLQLNHLIATPFKLSLSSFIFIGQLQFIWFPISILTTIRYCQFILKIFKNILTPQIFGKFCQYLLCAAQSDKPQLPHRASSKPKEKEMPINGNPIGYKSQSKLNIPYLNTYPFVGQLIFKYEVQNFQRIFMSISWSSFIIQMA